MKTTRVLVVTTFLLAVAACSKQESPNASSQAPTSEMPAMEKPMEASTNAMLPNEIDAKDKSGANVEQDASGKKVLYWHDPMMPDRHFSKSGKSPFMEMDLSPKYTE